MPSLKELKNRITSVKSTRKITSAMKMVAASKLRRAQVEKTLKQHYLLLTLQIEGYVVDLILIYSVMLKLGLPNNRPKEKLSNF
jgi:ATP synthase F1 gamma subunit